MPRWARTFVLLTGMLAWVAMVGATIWLKQPFGTMMMGFPAGLWYALNRRSAAENAGQESTLDGAPEALGDDTR